jgi:cellulose synthase/poly-beta-1,6-N-acetylglucosamine synthase-like glycosyltransferase
MIDTLNFVLVLLALVIAVPTLVLLTQILASLFHSRNSLYYPVRPSVAVVVPAHDESAMIGRTVAGIRSQLRAGDRLLVVADNCTDDTARLAAGRGAEVIERRDHQRRGKGYALDYGIRHLAQSEPPDVVVFVDADCDLGARAIETISALSAGTGRPVQATYLMRNVPGSGPIDRIAQFAWRVKNLLRPLGYHQLGLPCPLMGTAMAFPWSVINRADLATGHLAEDQKIGADLALAGSAPLFCPEAHVVSQFPATEDAKSGQRTRWEHGHLAAIREYVPSLLGRAIRRRDPSLFAFALDLAVPPLSLLVSLLALMGSLSLIWMLLAGRAAPLAIIIAAVIMLGAAIGLAWVRAGRDIIGLRDLFAITAYCALRLPSFFRFLTRRQIAWIRTERS